MSERATGKRRQLAASARLARQLGLRPGRADRFRLRTVNALPPPAFSELHRWPTWPDRPEDGQTRIFTLTGMIAARDALTEEIDGNRLRDYAGLVGEDLFERVLALPPGGNRRLGQPEAIAAQGRRLAEGALPTTLAERLGHDASMDSAAARFVAEAEKMVAEAER